MGCVHCVSSSLLPPALLLLSISAASLLSPLHPRSSPLPCLLCLNIQSRTSLWSVSKFNMRLLSSLTGWGNKKVQNSIFNIRLLTKIKKKENPKTKTLFISHGEFKPFTGMFVRMWGFFLLATAGNHGIVFWSTMVLSCRYEELS